MAESFSVKAILSAADKGFTSTMEKADSKLSSLGSKIKSGLGFGILTGIGQQAFSSITSGISGVISELGASSAAWKTFNGNMEMLGKSSDEIISTKKNYKNLQHKQSIVPVIWLLLTVSWSSWNKELYAVSKRFWWSCCGS